jgi:tetratricopeptide (TPR) repeat protein
MQSRVSPALASRLVPLLFAIVGAAIYANSFTSPLVLDDRVSILENAQIREWWRPDRVLFPDRELPVAGRPLVNVTLALNYALDGNHVAGYRIANLAIHVLCALALWGVARRTCLLPAVRTRFPDLHEWLPPPAALVWLVHPLNSEVVNYITQRTESLMALCYLLTLYCSIRALDKSRARAWSVLAVVCCAAGVACKESMVTAPIMVMLFDRIFVYRNAREMWQRRSPLYAGLLSTWVLLIALISTGPRIRSAGFSTGVSVWTYLLNQAAMITHYLTLAIWPRDLVVLYGPPLPLTLGDVWLNAALVMILLAMTVAALIRWPAIGLLGAWFFITLAPTSSILPIATEVGAERRMYLPLIALVILLLLAMRALWARTSVVVVALVLAGVLATATVLRNREYASTLTLAQTVLDRWPTGVAHQLMGEQLLAEGRREEAVAHLRQAVTTAPRAHYTLGAELLNEGKTAEAIVELKAFVAQEPLLLEVPSAHVMIAAAYAQQQQWPQAADEARAALAAAPGNADAQIRLADSLFREGAYADAITAYRTYVSAHPSDLDALANLGISLGATGNLQEAIKVFQQAVEVDPSNVAARRNLATALSDAGTAASDVRPPR